MKTSAQHLTMSPVLPKETTHFPFDHVLITFPDARAAQAADKGPLPELRRQYTGTTIMATTDPHHTRVGSGGGTLAALALAPNAKRTLILHAGGESSRCPTQMVLGKAWTSLPTSAPLDTDSSTTTTTPVAQWLRQCARWRFLPPGSVAVVASDTLLLLNNNLEQLGAEEKAFPPDAAVVSLAVPAPLATAQNHGVFVVTDSDNDDIIKPCRAVWQKPTIAELQEHCRPFFASSVDSSDEPHVWIDTGVVLFLPKAAAVLRELAAGPLVACTAAGLERLFEEQQSATTTESLQEFCRKRALKVDLYTHILQALQLDVPQRTTPQTTANNDDTKSPEWLPALKKALSSLPLHIWSVPSGQFFHLGTSRELQDFLIHGSNSIAHPDDKKNVSRRHALCQRFGQDLGLAKRVHCQLVGVQNAAEDEVHASAVLYHSSIKQCHRVGEGSVVEHSYWTHAPFEIGRDCWVSSLRSNTTNNMDPFILPDGLCLQMLPLRGEENEYVYMVFGVDDAIKDDTNVRVYGRSMHEFQEWAGLSDQDVWPLTATQHMLWTAKLHPVVKEATSFASVFSWLESFLARNQDPPESLQRWKDCRRLSLAEIRNQADALAEFTFRRDNSLKIQLYDMLMHRRHEPVEVSHTVVNWNVVATLDRTIQESLQQNMYDVAGRACRIMGDLLLREKEEGEDSLEDATKILRLQEERTAMYVSMLPIPTVVPLQLSSKANEELTIQSYGELMEQLAHAMTMKCVSPGLEIPPHNSEPLYDEWVVATAPARIDLAGGWSDTPPVCCEYGSSVTGLAVAIDGKIPLLCRCRLVTGSRGIVLRSESRHMKTGKLQSHTDAVLDSIRCLSDFSNPQSDCALLKCALICLGLSTRGDLQEQKTDLQDAIHSWCKRRDVRVEVVATSLLPHGSGLGTSSILGGCVLAAIGKCIGKDFGKMSALLDTVSVLEQQLTTGGGFQDQVNGLIGGVKTVRCEPHVFPLKLSVENIEISPAFRDQLDSRLVLAFTGKTRLAKNILHSVLSRWSKRTTDISHAVEKLVAGARRARDCVESGDLDSLAATFDEYWELKKTMAGPDSGVEPPWIKGLLSELRRRELIIGASLCGAGGGGFLALILAQGVSKHMLRDALDESQMDLADFEWHDCKVSNQGLVLRTLPDSSDPMDFFDLGWVENCPLSNSEDVKT